MPSASTFFTPEQQEDIRQAIRDAELDTSGEIRVHIENHHPHDVKNRAAEIFKKLHMHETQHRNGVLFYLALKSRSFAIIGDEGINNVVEELFWESVKVQMINHFREGDFTGGLVEGILMAGRKLKAYFPYQTQDVNELPDDISFASPKEKDIDDE